MEELDEFESGDFTPAERQNLRRMARDWERYQWAWGLLARIGMWGVGVVTAIYAAREPIARVFRAIFPSHTP